MWECAWKLCSYKVWQQYWSWSCRRWMLHLLNHLSIMWFRQRLLIQQTGTYHIITGIFDLCPILSLLVDLNLVAAVTSIRSDLRRQLNSFAILNWVSIILPCLCDTCNTYSLNVQATIFLSLSVLLSFSLFYLFNYFQIIFMGLVSNCPLLSAWLILMGWYCQCLIFQLFSERHEIESLSSNILGNLKVCTALHNTNNKKSFRRSFN